MLANRLGSIGTSEPAIEIGEKAEGGKAVAAASEAVAGVPPKGNMLWCCCDVVDVDVYGRAEVEAKGEILPVADDAEEEEVGAAPLLLLLKAVKRDWNCSISAREMVETGAGTDVGSGCTTCCCCCFGC